MVYVANASPELDAMSRYPSIIAVCVVMSALASIVVCTRLKVRQGMKTLKADDWMALVAMIMGIAYSVLCIVQTKYGLGLKPAIRPKANIDIYSKVNYAGRPIYQMGISCFKLALLISYLRLVQDTQFRIYRMVVWFAFAFVFLAHLGCTLSLIFACQPVQKSWIPSTPGKCIPDGPSFTGYAVVTIVSDIMVALLPIPVLLKINITRQKKFGLIGIFALGLFTTICSIMRYLQINEIQYGDHDSTMLVVWGVIEFNVGNMISSLPFLAPVFMRKVKEYRSERSRYGYGSNKGYGSNQGNSSRNTDGGQSHALGYIKNKKGTFASSSSPTSSRTDDAAAKQNAGIFKSVTYTVSVEDEEALIERRGQQAHTPGQAYTKDEPYTGATAH